MKICGVICEFNPFHNGHAYLIKTAKEISRCDALVCVMSGNFTQRGEMALLDKYTRAKHAIFAGADAVIELPTVFAISPAEIFAKGAVKLLASLPGFSHLAFGCEGGDQTAFLSAAQASLREGEHFRTVLREKLRAGMSLTKARAEALSVSANIPADLNIAAPNTILGIEYQKALLSFRSDAQIIPIRRQGAGHSDPLLYEGFSSASAIRQATDTGNVQLVQSSVPPFVYADLQDATDHSDYKKIAVYSLLSHDRETIRSVLDCTEGLENRLLKVAAETPEYDTIVAAVTSKRYISSRIRRILAANTLGISQDCIRLGLRCSLYLKPLALRQQTARTILSAFSESSFPLITRKQDIAKLSDSAAAIYKKDILASMLYSAVSTKKVSEKMLLL